MITDKDGKRWYTVVESATLIKSTLDSDLPQGYWTAFIHNYSRGKRSTRTNTPAWAKMTTTKLPDGAVYVSEDSLEAFVTEAVKHEFPLGSINGGYTKNAPTKPPSKPIQSEVAPLEVVSDAPGGVQIEASLVLIEGKLVTKLVINRSAYFLNKDETIKLGKLATFCGEALDKTSDLFVSELE